MKLKLGFIISVYFCCFKSFSQDAKIDSSYIVFSEQLRITIFKELDNVLLDTNNFIGVYMFKFNIKGKNDIKESLCSKGTPEKLCQAVKKSITNLITSNNSFTKLYGHTFILPIIVDFEGNINKYSVRKITATDASNLLMFDDTPQKDKPSQFAYTGNPLECILLPPFFYQPPHFNNTSVDKFKPVLKPNF